MTPNPYSKNDSGTTYTARGEDGVDVGITVGLMSGLDEVLHPGYEPITVTEYSTETEAVWFIDDWPEAAASLQNETITGVYAEYDGYYTYGNGDGQYHIDTCAFDSISIDFENVVEELVWRHPDLRKSNFAMFEEEEDKFVGDGGTEIQIDFFYIYAVIGIAVGLVNVVMRWGMWPTIGAIAIQVLMVALMIRHSQKQMESI